MRYRVLGGTGIEVSVHCLGTMMFGSVGNPDHDDCVRIIHAALDSGINFVDTADMYSAGESEEIVGKALRGRRDEVVLATKVHFPMGEGRNRGGNSRRWIVNEVEESLRRLGTDWIDLYQIHRPDPTTDIEETLSALTDLVSGRARSARSAARPSRPRRSSRRTHVAERRGARPVPHRAAAVLASWPAASRRSVLPVCQRYGMGVLVWSPLASGFLTGRYRKGQPIDMSTGRPTHRAGPLRPVEPVERPRSWRSSSNSSRSRTSVGCTLPELALAFTAAHPAVTSTIIGPRTMEQLEASLKGAALALDDGDAGPDRRDRAARHERLPARRCLAPAGARRPAMRRRPPDQRAAA